MYKNVGKKIMVLAKVFGWLFFFVGIIAGLINLDDGNDLVGYVALAIGVVSLISSWYLYGFGQLVDDVKVIRNASTGAKKQAIPDELPEL